MVPQTGLRILLNSIGMGGLCGHQSLILQYLRPPLTMNFLKFLSSGAGILNFSFSNPSMLNQPLLPSQPNLKSEGEEHPEHSPSQQPMPSNTLEQLLIKQQQELLNECIKLNLELIGSSTNKDQVSQSEDQLSLRKRIKKINKCEHTDRKHYAKGLCNNCYHRFGRNKKPWNCTHDVLYAAGMCQNCYINRYNKLRRDQGQKPSQEDPQDQLPHQNLHEDASKSQRESE